MKILTASIHGVPACLWKGRAFSMRKSGKVRHQQEMYLTFKLCAFYSANDIERQWSSTLAGGCLPCIPSTGAGSLKLHSCLPARDFERSAGEISIPALTASCVSAGKLTI